MPRKKTVVRKKIIDANDQQASYRLRERKKKQLKAAGKRAAKRKQGKRSR